MIPEYREIKKRSIASIFSSVPPNQYCMHKNHARKSCALPGMYFRILGRRRSIRIFFSPVSVDGFDEPRRRFSKAIVPLSGVCISREPMRVCFTKAASHMIPTTASHWSRRASITGSSGFTCSSRNNRFHATRFWF